MILKVEIILFSLYIHYSYFKFLRVTLLNTTFVTFAYWEQLYITLPNGTTITFL